MSETIEITPYIVLFHDRSAVSKTSEGLRLEMTVHGVAPSELDAEHALGLFMGGGYRLPMVSDFHDEVLAVLTARLQKAEEDYKKLWKEKEWAFNQLEFLKGRLEKYEDVVGSVGKALRKLP